MKANNLLCFLTVYLINLSLDHAYLMWVLNAAIGFLSLFRVCRFGIE